MGLKYPLSRAELLEGHASTLLSPLFEPFEAPSDRPASGPTAGAEISKATRSTTSEHAERPASEPTAAGEATRAVLLAVQVPSSLLLSSLELSDTKVYEP